MMLFDEAMRRDPHPVYRALRRAGGVQPIAGTDMVLLLDYEHVKRAFGDHETFGSNVAPSRNVELEWLLFLDPPRHEHLRAIVSKAFTPRSIAALEPVIRDVSRSLLDSVTSRAEVDWVEAYAAPLPMMVITEMLGLPREEWPRLTRFSEAIMNLGSTILGTPEASRAASEAFMEANGEMMIDVQRAVAHRRRAPRDDLLTRLALSEVEGARLTDLEILRFVQLLLAAGTETTTNLIDNAMLSFIEHPSQLSLLRATPSLLPSAIEEVLRYRSPAQVMFRVARRDVELGGCRIEKGKMLLVGIGAANRDPRVFADADTFDIARSPNPHLAFGQGIHFCLGAPLSRLEGKVAIFDVLERISTFALASDAPWEPRAPFHVHGPTRLPIRLEAKR